MHPRMTRSILYNQLQSSQPQLSSPSPSRLSDLGLAGRVFFLLLWSARFAAFFWTEVRKKTFVQTLTLGDASTLITGARLPRVTAAGRKLEPKPRHYLVLGSEETREKLERDFDEFGDSYCEEIGGRGEWDRIRVDSNWQGSSSAVTEAEVSVWVQKLMSEEV